MWSKSWFINHFMQGVLVVCLLLSAGCTRSFTQAPQDLASKITPTRPSETPTPTEQPTQQVTISPSPTVEIPTATVEPSSTPETQEPIVELPVRILPLSGPADSPEAEFSGMAWAGDTLILLPQHPEKFKQDGSPVVFGLAKSGLLAAIESDTPAPQEPVPIPFDLAGLESSIPGFDGFESIAVDGDRVYLTVESRQEKTSAFLVSGSIAPDLSRISLNPASLAPIPAQADLTNVSDEALLVFGRRLMTFYEANGRTVNPNPVAHLFDLDGNLMDEVRVQNVEYRITDVTPPDEFGRFWAINYFFKGDEYLSPVPDPVAREFGEGATHARTDTVERLLEFQIGESGITLSGSAPLYLELLGGARARNWEGIARLGSAGFLLVTDRYPETILCFVAIP